MSKIKTSHILLSAGLLIVELLLIPRVIEGFSYIEPLGVATRAAAFLIVIFGIYAIFKLLLAAKIKRVLLLNVIVILCVTGLVLLIVGMGVLQDALGAHCTGFFGASTSCSSSYSLPALVIAFHPLTLFILGATSFVATLYQITSDFKKR